MTDFIDHRLLITDSGGRSRTLPLEPKSVAQFYRAFMDGLRALGIGVRIMSRPVEVPEAIPFESDEKHASYDPRQAQLFWHGLLQADRVMKAFQTGFVGKASPVHFFWGSFDLATTRFSGRRAPLHPGGVVPNIAAWVDAETFSREETASAGGRGARRRALRSIHSLREGAQRAAHDGRSASDRSAL